ncbi:hypothetical protein SK128_007206 [Halocaridina rubra]|uniref:Uncharacterized protein n=1 Tax=Halocaridina rubra TaxID=373956 RepID=A0AAN8X827_HALRR
MFTLHPFKNNGFLQGCIGLPVYFNHDKLTERLWTYFFIRCLFSKPQGNMQQSTTRPMSTEPTVTQKRPIASVDNTEKSSYIIVKVWSLVDGQLQLAGSQRVPVSENSGLSIDKNKTNNVANSLPCNNTYMLGSQSTFPSGDMSEYGAVPAENFQPLPSSATSLTNLHYYDMPSAQSSYTHTHDYDFITSTSAYPLKHYYNSNANNFQFPVYNSQTSYPNQSSHKTYYPGDQSLAQMHSQNQRNKGSSQTNHYPFKSSYQEPSRYLNKGDVTIQSHQKPQQLRKPIFQALLQSLFIPGNIPLSQPSKHEADGNKLGTNFEHSSSFDINDYLTLLQIIYGFNLARSSTPQNFNLFSNQTSTTYSSKLQTDSFNIQGQKQSLPENTSVVSTLSTVAQQSHTKPTLPVEFTTPPQMEPQFYSLQQVQPNFTWADLPVPQGSQLNLNSQVSHSSISPYGILPFYAVTPKTAMYQSYSQAPPSYEKTLYQASAQVLPRRPPSTILADYAADQSSNERFNIQEQTSQTDSKFSTFHSKHSGLLHSIPQLDDQAALLDIMNLLEILHKIQEDSEEKGNSTDKKVLTSSNLEHQTIFSDIQGQVPVNISVAERPKIKPTAEVITETPIKQVTTLLPYFHHMPPATESNIPYHNTMDPEKDHDVTEPTTITQAKKSEIIDANEENTEITSTLDYTVDVADIFTTFSNSTDDITEATYVNLTSLLTANTLNPTNNTEHVLPSNESYYKLQKLDELILTTVFDNEQDTDQEDNYHYTEWPILTTENPITNQSQVNKETIPSNDSYIRQPQTPAPNILPTTPFNSFGGIGNPSLIGVPIALQQNSYIVPTVRPQAGNKIHAFGGVGNPALVGHPLLIGGNFGQTHDDSGFVAFKNAHPFLKVNQSISTPSHISEFPAPQNNQHLNMPITGDDENNLDKATFDAYNKILYDLQQLEILEKMLTSIESQHPQKAETIRLIAMESVLRRNPLLVQYLTRSQSTPRRNSAITTISSTLEELLEGIKIPYLNAGKEKNSGLSNFASSLIKIAKSKSIFDHRNQSHDINADFDNAQEPLTYLIQGTHGIPPTLTQLQSSLKQYLQQSILFQHADHGDYKDDSISSEPSPDHISNYTLTNDKPYPTNTSSVTLSSNVVRPNTDILSNEVIMECLKNMWCAFSLALSVGVGAAGAMAAPFVAPALGRKRRDLLGKFPTEEPVVHIITYSNPDLNLYDALIEKPMQHYLNNKDEVENHHQPEFQDYEDSITKVISALFEKSIETETIPKEENYMTLDDNANRYVSLINENSTAFPNENLYTKLVVTPDHYSGDEHEKGSHSAAECQKNENDIIKLITAMYEEFNLTKIINFDLLNKYPSHNNSAQIDSNMSILISSLLEDYDSPNSQFHDYDENNSMVNDYNYDDLLLDIDYDSLEPPDFFLPPPVTSPLHVIDNYSKKHGTKKSANITALYSTVPGFSKPVNDMSLKDDAVTQIKKKKKPTKSVSERRKRPYDCFTNETCSLSVALAMAVVPILAVPFLGKRRRRETTGEDVKIREGILKDIHSLMLRDKQFLIEINSLLANMNSSGEFP